MMLEYVLSLCDGDHGNPEDLSITVGFGPGRIVELPQSVKVGGVTYGYHGESTKPAEVGDFVLEYRRSR